MRIVDPQNATLTNVEVLAYLTANPPRKSAAAPPGVHNYVPKPDLRDHCTVVTEIHNYVDRASPHLYDYPRYTQADQRPSTTYTFQQPSTDQQEPYIQPTEPTPLDHAIRNVIRELAPYGLTKAEVMMFINLGIGLKRRLPASEVEQQEDEETNQEGEEEEDLYKDQAIIDVVVEEFSERLNEESMLSLVEIMRRNFGKSEESS